MTEKLACALRLFQIKSQCNLMNNAFHQTMVAVNGGDVSLFQVKETLESIIPIKPKYMGRYLYQLLLCLYRKV